MQYLGGKARIAKRIAAIINAERAGRVVWEPFCGGAWMTRALAAAGPVRAGDVHPGLIALYQIAQRGGIPDYEPNITREDWDFCKTLPVSDPRAAFVGFGCSFGGSYFAAPALGNNGSRPYGSIAADNVRKIGALTNVTFECASFFDRKPESGVIAYLDPPYRGTASYRGVGSFDHAAFDDRVKDWVSAGATVFVSEYAFPFGRVVWENTARGTFGASHGACKERTERLYRWSQ